MVVVAKLRGVRKSFRGVPVLCGVDLEVRQGELLLVRGRSGTGKTTLLRILGLLERADEGEVVVLGVDGSRASEAEKARVRLEQIGFVHQFFNLIPTLTVLENVELPLLLRGVGKAERRRRALGLLRALGLDGKAKRFPAELSGGERQRVAIARALVGDPVLLLADEPLSNLDDHTAGLVLDLLRDSCRSRGLAVVMTTTDLYSELPADRDCFLSGGRLVEYAPVKPIHSQSGEEWETP